MTDAHDVVRELAQNLLGVRGRGAALLYCEARMVDAAYLADRAAVAMWNDVAEWLERDSDAVDKPGSITTVALQSDMH